MHVIATSGNCTNNNVMGLVIVFTCVNVYYIFADRFRIIVTASGVQQVGNSLTLNCNIIDLVSGSNNLLEIVWTDNNNIVLRRSNVTSDSLSVYTDSYTIMQLTISDEGRMIRCTANSIDSPVMESVNIILDVFGKLKGYLKHAKVCHYSTVLEQYAL